MATTSLLILTVAVIIGTGLGYLFHASKAHDKAYGHRESEP